MTTLSGKKVLVTGGSRGIGAAIALRLAREGADVALTYSASADRAKAVVADIEKAGRKAFALKADAANPEDMPHMLEDAVSKLGGLDILVNNAGVFEGALLADTPLDTLDRVLDINVRAVYALTRAAAAHMKPGGRIINIGSVLGERAMDAGMAVYNASKFAVAGLSRSWAHDLGPQGITVNCIQPGPIDTDMNPANGTDFAEGLRTATALKRYGKPEEIAALAAFLASGESSYITGATINVDGGMNA